MFGKELRDDGHLTLAMLNSVNVEVYYKDGEVADNGGKIEEVVDYAVKINDMYYMKAACRFFIR